MRCAVCCLITVQWVNYYNFNYQQLVIHFPTTLNKETKTHLNVLFVFVGLGELLQCDYREQRYILTRARFLAETIGQIIIDQSIREGRDK